MAYLQHIPGLTEWVFFMPDDILLRKPFDVHTMFQFDGKIKSILLRGARLGFDSLTTALHQHFPKWNVREGFVLFVAVSWITQMELGLDFHAPFLVKKCYLEEIEVEFCDSLFKCKPGTDLSVCEFDAYHFQLFVQNYLAIREKSDRNFGDYQAFARELHTNGSPSGQMLFANLKRNDTFFLNLQGDGVSDEYSFSSEIRELVDDWYFSEYPAAGAVWERPKYFDGGK